MLSLIPRKVDQFEIRHTVIPKGTELMMYNADEGRMYKGIYTEDYEVTVLTEGGKLWMSDSLMEREALRNPIREATGDVLACGLGLGIFPALIRDKPDVTSIDVIDSSLDIICLIFGQIADGKMAAVQMDMWEYLTTTEKRYDYIYMDIWQGTNGPIQEADKALEAAQRCLKPDGKAACWLQELYDRVRDKLVKEPIYPTAQAGFHEPCLLCSKVFRNDYAGLCMDCADVLGVSELYLRRQHDSL